MLLPTIPGRTTDKVQLIRLVTVCAAVLICCGQIRAEREVVDRIAIVVGDEVILASEISGQIQMYVLQKGIRPQSESEMKKLRDDIIEQMISDRLFIIAARKDTNLTLREDEIDQALDNRMADIAANFPSQDDFLAALADEGISLRDYRKKSRPDIENQLLKNRLIQQKLYTVSVSRHEVVEFYNEFADSIPIQPEAVRLAHVLLGWEPSPGIEDSVKRLAAELRQAALDGADFASISAQYSSFGAGAEGGDLGYIAREDVVPEFARAAFNLSVGDISGVIRTQFGYHVITCYGKRDERLKLRHILLGVLPSKEDSTMILSLADSLLKAARSGDDFAEMAKEHSVDNSTRAQGGELGWIATAQMPADIAPYVRGWDAPGEYRGPVSTPEGIHLLKLLEYSPEKKYNLENDFDKIKELARQDKTGKLVDKWIAELRASTYTDYRLGFDEN